MWDAGAGGRPPRCAAPPANAIAAGAGTPAESRRIDLHHIQYWSHGGRTSLKNMICLCRHHHMLVHDRGYLIASAPGGAFTFYDPGGTVIPPRPPLPPPRGPDRRLPR